MSRLRVVHLMMLVPFVLLAWTAGLPIGDNSFLWHVRAGTLQLDTGEVLRTDPFSFTAFGEPWRTQSWLAELGYGWLERATGGIAWVPIMKLLAMTMTVALVAIVIHRVARGSRAVTIGGLLLLVWQAAPFNVARPALLGFVLLAMVVAVINIERRPLWLLPPLFWLWAAIHGMFVVGLGLVVLDAFRRRSRRTAIAALIAGGATALTAHGLGTWWLVLQFFRNRAALDLISEWHPPDFTNPFVVPLLLVIIGLVVAGARNRLPVADLWIAIPFIVFGVTAERNILPAVLVLTPIAALAAGPSTPERRISGRELVAVNWVIAGALAMVGYLGVARPVTLLEERFPAEEATAALQQGPLFNGSAVGGYLIYADWPGLRVFIDDRAELYGEDGFRRFHDLKSGVGIEDSFAELGIKQAIVTADWPIVEYLELLGWTYRYEDEYFVVMAEE